MFSLSKQCCDVGVARGRCRVYRQGRVEAWMIVPYPADLVCLFYELTAETTIQLLIEMVCE